MHSTISIIKRLQVTDDSRYPEFAYLEKPLLSKWKSGPRFNIKISQLVTKYCGKRVEIAPMENFPLFHNIFNISLSRSPISYSLVKSGCSFYFLLNSANLICRGTDISKYFRESLGLQDNESQLYMLPYIRCRSCMLLINRKEQYYLRIQENI